ncbi:glyoxalase [Acidihalobacter aeolianus]|uniref:Glyoxalase n=1 Tax=Acidihalobacter aeolianus TaxID=2792603 RepID=A0A1D8KAR2_9GAMM|nr:VOC family protein [Acidihalobacter aeolianus]AOV18053.1 glyoxalase [Acidihalobacter aeolianus]
MQRPPATGGMRHLALNVINLEAAERFYVELLGMGVEWRPDPDNLYLCSGCDNLALHRAAESAHAESGQRLDHLGFILREPEDVDAWFEFLQAHDVPIDKPPRTHRDGARSFYCFDPDGNRVQMIYHPPVAAACG